MILAWVASFFTATTVILGLLLGRSSKDRDDWARRAAAHLKQVHEARSAAVKARFALAAAQKDIAAAKKKAEERMVKIRAARGELDQAAGDPAKVAELWDQTLGE